MIVKKLREQRNWSQEQLAIFSGLSVRTIQRIESGNKASLESLKSLASVFETKIETLTEAVMVIDKKSEIWESQPRWFKFSLWGVSKRRSLIYVELLCLIFGLVAWAATPGSFATPTLIVLAYAISKLITHADRQRLW